MTNNSRLTNTLGTNSTSFAIDEMVIEHIRSGPNAGTKISFPDQPAIYLRAANPAVASKWYNGNDDPAEDLGNENDYYLKISTGQIFFRQNATWNFISDLTGPIGGQGEIGNQGTQGVAGPPGPAASIDEAADTTITNPAQDHVLVFDALTAKWINIDLSTAFGLFAVDLLSDQNIQGNKTFPDQTDAHTLLTNTPDAGEDSRRVPTTAWVKDITDPLLIVPYLTIGVQAGLPNERSINFSNDFTILDNDGGGTYDISLLTTGVSAGTYGKVTVLSLIHI